MSFHMNRRQLLRRLGLVAAMYPLQTFLTGCERSAESILGPETNRQLPRPGTEPHNATTGYAWTYGDWTARVNWEARYALSMAAKGVSGRSLSADRYGPRWYGDWNYVGSDPFALGRAKIEAKYITGAKLGWIDGYACGGTCTFFVRLVLYRATYGAPYGVHLTTPNHPGSVYSWCDWAHMTRRWGEVRPGFVASSPGNHMALFDQRAFVNGVWGWYLIDSNYVGWNGGERIGKHFLPDTVLNAQNYWAWYPSWATPNT